MTPGRTDALNPDDLQRLQRILLAFVTEVGARGALLMDRGGHCLAAAGDVEDLDGSSFAVLATADFDASRQLAGLLGDRDLKQLFHHGAHGSMFLCSIGAAGIFAALVDSGTSLATLRLRSTALVERLEAILREADGRTAARGALHTGFAREAVGAIDRVFAG